MNICSICNGPMKLLFISFYCQNCDDGVPSNLYRFVMSDRTWEGFVLTEDTWKKSYWPNGFTRAWNLALDKSIQEAVMGNFWSPNKLDAPGWEIKNRPLMQYNLDCGGVAVFREVK